MRKITLLALIGALILGFSSCKKEDLPSMSAKLNNNVKNFIFRSTVMGGVPGVGDGFLIVGTTLKDSSGEYIALLIRGTDVKSYSLNVALDNGKYQCEALYRQNGSNDTANVYIGKSGTITISDLDEKHKKVSGTFSMSMVNKNDASQTLNVTEGQFSNLSYVYLDADIVTNDFDL